MNFRKEHESEAIEASRSNDLLDNSGAEHKSDFTARRAQPKREPLNQCRRRF